MEKKPPQSGAEIYMEVVTAAAGNFSSAPLVHLSSL